MEGKQWMSFSAEVKRTIAKEVEDGTLSLREAAERAHTSVNRVKMWLEEYGRFKPKHDRVEVVMKSEQDRIAALEKALAEAHLKIQVYDEIIKLAGKKYQVDLKKNFGTERSSLFAEEPKGALKRSAKR